MNKKTLKEYRIWKAMKSRCYAPSQNKGHYKDRGIEVCDRWRNSFENFMEDMGPIPDDTYSIERLDPYGNYEPSNCIWLPMKKQPQNRSNSIFIEENGQKMCLKEYARLKGIKYTTLYMKLRREKEKA